MNEMTFDVYQEQAWSTAIYPNKGNNIVYPTLGLCGESGEFAEKIKKMIRDDDGVMTDEKRVELIKEASDIMWYLSAVCKELGVSMGSVARTNLDKLHSRMKRGKLQGSGDER